ncbi:M14 family zinc carboxypeptidase [Streptomyces sp. NPDC048717]|uniref:M14 family zinc carboxypeptidase n=1 Tax=Streptomyces sp. NPDC048717 TaxID=3154928 RepID=UPI0034420116
MIRHFDAAAYVGGRPPTLDELDLALHTVAAEHPEICSLREIGRSRAGRPMPMLTVPGGPLPVLVLGAPHPNEPIGLATVLALARYVTGHAEAREQVTWHIVGCTDPDGVAANESWWASTPWPPSLEAYHRGLYRPPAVAQPEWTFPTPHFTATLPETRALMGVIDTARPALTVSLHNSDSAGAFLLASRAEPWLAEVMADIAGSHGLSVEGAPMDCIGLQPQGKGAFVLPAVTPPPQATGGEEGTWGHTGASSAHYTARHGGLGILPEVPMWGTAPIDLPSEKAVGILTDAHDALGRLIDRLPQPQDIFFLNAAIETRSILPRMAQLIRENPEAGSGQDLALLIPCRAAGMLLRHIDQCLVATPHSLRLHEARDGVDSFLRAWCLRAEQALRPRPLPLSRTAGYQLEMTLAVAEQLAAAPSSTSGTDT